MDGAHLKIISWNARSVDIPKAIEISKLHADVTFIQEIWRPSTQALEFIGGHQEIKKRDDLYGGTLLAWKEEWMRPVSQPLSLNEDSNIIKCSLADNRSIWIGSIYISKKSKKNLLNLFANIKNHIPEAEWPRLLLAGDWNINLLDPSDKVTQALNLLIEQTGLSIYHAGPSRENHCLDYILAGRDITVTNLQKISSPYSDHAIITANIEIPKPTVSKNLKIPNRNAAEKITFASLAQSSNSAEFLRNVDTRMKERNYNILKTIKPRKYERDLLKSILQIQEEDADIKRLIEDYWSNLNRHNENLRYSKT